jgi:hypothetical protein
MHFGILFGKASDALSLARKSARFDSRIAAPVTISALRDRRRRLLRHHPQNLVALLDHEVSSIGGAKIA